MENSIENTLKTLEELLVKMESEDISLEDSFTLYESGLKLVNECYSKIEKIEQKIEQVGESNANE